MKALPLNCLVVEDRKEEQIHILSIIEESEYLKCMQIFDNIDTTKEFLRKNNNIDVIFLDLELSGRFTGVDLLYMFEGKNDIPSIIICSSERELLLESIEYNEIITGYLKKPFGKEKFNKLIESNLDKLRAVKKFGDTHSESSNSTLKNFHFWHTFSDKEGAVDVRIAHKDIAYISVFGNYSTFILLNKERIDVQISLKKIEEIIPANLYYRISKDKLLCNPACVEKYNSNNRELAFHNNLSVSVGESYHRGLRAYLEAYI